MKQVQLWLFSQLSLANLRLTVLLKPQVVFYLILSETEIMEDFAKGLIGVAKTFIASTR